MVFRLRRNLQWQGCIAQYFSVHAAAKAFASLDIRRRHPLPQQSGDISCRIVPSVARSARPRTDGDR